MHTKLLQILIVGLLMTVVVLPLILLFVPRFHMFGSHVSRLLVSRLLIAGLLFIARLLFITWHLLIGRLLFVAWRLLVAWLLFITRLLFISGLFSICLLLSVVLLFMPRPLFRQLMIIIALRSMIVHMFVLTSIAMRIFHSIGHISMLW